MTDSLSNMTREELLDNLYTYMRMVTNMAYEIATARARLGKEWDAQAVIYEYYNKAVEKKHES
jgi:hypothetical protein